MRRPQGCLKPSRWLPHSPHDAGLSTNPVSTQRAPASSARTSPCGQWGAVLNAAGGAITPLECHLHDRCPLNVSPTMMMTMSSLGPRPLACRNARGLGGATPRPVLRKGPARRGAVCVPMAAATPTTYTRDLSQPRLIQHKVGTLVVCGRAQTASGGGELVVSPRLNGWWVDHPPPGA